MKPKLKESDLFEPVYAYLTALGYDVKAEVEGCDIAAVFENELIVVELKRNFTLELVFQAIDRQRSADGVYVCVPMPQGGYRGKKYKNMVMLCKRLQLGLMLVGFTTEGIPMVDVAVHPAGERPVAKKPKKRAAILKEHHARTGNSNQGGVSRTKIITAYKEELLKIARLLQQESPLSAAEIKARGFSDKCGSMLSRNYYHWFIKEGKGRACKYSLSEQGRKALLEYRHIVDKL
jgi:hypothetical protein